MTANSIKTAFLKSLNSSEAPFTLNSASEIIIGRDFDCQLRLSSAGGVSRRHASIRWVPEQNTYVLTDLGSANGTYVNGQRLQGAYGLRSGDRIQLGANGPELLFEDSTLPATAVDLNPQPFYPVPVPAPQGAAPVTPVNQSYPPSPDYAANQGHYPSPGYANQGQHSSPGYPLKRNIPWKWIIGGIIGVAGFSFASQVIEMGSFGASQDEPTPVASSPAKPPAGEGGEQGKPQSQPQHSASSKYFDNFFICINSGNNTCAEDMSTLTTSQTKAVVVTADYRDVPVNSKVEVYVGTPGNSQREKLDELALGETTTGVVYVTLNPPNGSIPAGQYEFTLVVAGEPDSAISKILTVQ